MKKVEEVLVRAIVKEIVYRGKWGLYAVAISNDVEGSIVFSPRKPYWNEEALPQLGMVVILSDLHKRRFGWRATRGRFMRPTDYN